jgi:hypothetical protein
MNWAIQVANADTRVLRPFFFVVPQASAVKKMLIIVIILIDIQIFRIKQSYTRGVAVDSNNRPNRRRRRRSWRCCIDDYWTADVSLHLHITSGVTFLD